MWEIVFYILVLYCLYSYIQPKEMFKLYFDNLIESATTPIYKTPEDRVGIYSKDYYWNYGPGYYMKSGLGKVSHNYEPRKIRDYKFSFTN